MRESENETQRTDIAETPALEKPADEHDHHNEAVKPQAQLEAGKRRRYRRSRTEVAEVAADKTDTEEDDQHYPFHQAENGIQFFVE